LDYNEKADIWSIGMLLYSFLTGEAYFTADSEDEILERIKRYEIFSIFSDLSKKW